MLRLSTLSHRGHGQPKAARFGPQLDWQARRFQRFCLSGEKFRRHRR
jgi:hypothetical protein